MSLDLNCGTTPDHTRAFTRDSKVILMHEVQPSSVSMSLIDFCELAKYVLTNTDLVDDDPRLALVEYCQSLEQVPGWNGAHSRKLGVK